MPNNKEDKMFIKGNGDQGWLGPYDTYLREGKKKKKKKGRKTEVNGHFDKIISKKKKRKKEGPREEKRRDKSSAQIERRSPSRKEF